MLTTITYIFVFIMGIIITYIAKIKLRLQFHPFTIFLFSCFIILSFLPNGCTHLVDENKQLSSSQETTSKAVNSNTDNGTENNKKETIKKEDNTVSKIKENVSDTVIENVSEIIIDNNDNKTNEPKSNTKHDKILAYQGKGLEVYVLPNTIVNHNDGYFEVIVLENNKSLRYEFFREGVIWQYSAESGSGRIENRIYVQRIFETCQQYR